MATAIQPEEVFRQEAADLLAVLETTLLDLEAAPDRGELIDQAFRSLHTLKGSGAMFGWDALADFAHHIESVFQKVREGTLAATRDLVSLTLASLDHLRVLLEHPGQADRVRGDALLLAFADLAAVAASDPTLSAAAAGPGAAASPAEDPKRLRVFRIGWRPASDMLAFGGNPLLLLDELRGLGPCTVIPITDRIPPLETMDPTGCTLGWDIMLTTDRPRAAIDDVFMFTVGTSELAIDEVPLDDDSEAPPRLGEILVRRGDVTAGDVDEELGHQPRLGTLLVQSGKVSGDRIASALDEQRHLRETARAREAKALGNSIRVPAERLDSLMDQVGELVIAQARLVQATAGGTALLKSIAEDIQRLAGALRDTTMSVRMLPIGTLFARFRRVVHDVSRELGKTVELTMSGEETELDKTVIESLNDPLVHLIRNAMDHGLETAEQRAAQGKPAAGHLHLSAVHSGAQVLIAIKDDGRGLDRAAIRVKAEERGLLQPGQEVGDRQLFACIFQPGFSTAATVTSLSGRGVGMDVVERAVASLRGTIEVASEPGRGTSITLKLPLTLAIIDGLLVRIADERYIVPLSVIEECVELSRREDQRSDGRSFLNIRGEIVAFVRLRRLFGATGTAPELQKVVIVSFGEVRVGLVVDQVLGQHQTVIKSLSRLHDDQEGFSGATILGDGSVALILDVPHLIRFARDRETGLRTA
jgi:two-component system chemotaxis sensor kinase CheA